ncbi:MAG: ribulose-phosphate 3-epimerase [Coriobacteriales bacterium]|jgi:ribulose-phosphate 3-epimerase|nr:ribulose-phosphate 3-epimerase [Coriobacteriales bacterium]
MTENLQNTGILIAPSLLSADFMNLSHDVQMIEKGFPDWLHVDVMDGHFVPNLTIGPPVIKALKAITDIPLDIHLMIDNPSYQLDWYIEAGADSITVHIECFGQTSHIANTPGTSLSINSISDPDLLAEVIVRIHTAGRKAGLALNPDTPVELALPWIDQIDLVLLMSVHPGFGGQSFIHSTVEKIATVSKAAAANAPGLLIEVDGGINASTAALAVEAGANILVAGNAIFAESDPLTAMADIRAAATSLGN